MTARPAEAGFTLIELMIALALFALIAVAGMALVESVLGIRARTEHRLDGLGEIERAMFMLGDDLEQTAGSAVRGDATTLSFGRHAPAPGGIVIPIRYVIEDGHLARSTGGPTGGTQRLLGGVSGLRWRYYRRSGQWTDRWPANPGEAGTWPAAVSVDILLSPNPQRPSGALRRVIALPEHP